MSNILEPENPFEHVEYAVSDHHNPMARLIRRRKGNSESEDKQVLLALDLASLLSCSTNEDGANIRQRRRAQNRASQRAFRERKRSHTEDLQQQLNKLHETHHFLQETYQQNVDELSNMKAYVDELNFEISMLQMKSGAQPGLFEAAEGTGAWKAPKVESNASYSTMRPDEPGASDFSTPLSFAAEQTGVDASSSTNSSSSPATAWPSTGVELIWS
jgi:hypothetical protein